ncbi:MAG: hypothetical protein HYV09_01695 [Deltaproteobacteria bacterium]|nr:hypothetical protein [Deltaproteobacteria bacterium]
MSRWNLALLPLTLAFAVSGGCASDQDDAVTGPSDEIVDVGNSRVKNQSIGNCWLYASVGWVEALHLRATGVELDLSETYLTFWDWYEKLTRATSAPPESITTGGFFTTATRLMNTYGLLDEGVFIPGEATTDRSAAQSQAESYVNNSLKSGVLRTDRSPATVRKELAKAFGLTPQVVAYLDQTFGPAAPKLGTVPAGFPLRKTSDLVVAQKKAGQPVANVKLRDEIYRWREYTKPTDRGQLRNYLRRVQKALHDAQPVLIVWNVDWESRDRVSGTFPKMQPSAKIDGVHMTILEDYQAAYVPNIGTLPAGVTVTDTTILNAALAAQVEIPFFRIKNSWGNTADPSGSGAFKGYADLYGGYLFPTDTTAPAGLISFTLPSDYDTNVPAGIAPDLCEKAAADGNYCASGLGATSTDKRLFTCDTGMSGKVQTCASLCKKGATGGTDACGEPPPPNPCEKATSPGKYCGSALGIASGQPGYSTLYSCQKDVNGTWISPGTECPKGCIIYTSMSDRCKP